MVQSWGVSVVLIEAVLAIPRLETVTELVAQAAFHKLTTLKVVPLPNHIVIGELCSHSCVEAVQLCD